MHRVSIIGASGYSGMELTRILLAHRDIRVVAAGSDKLHARPIENPGTTTSGLTASGSSASGSTASVSTYVTQAEAIATDCDVAFLATPAEVSLELAPKLLAAGKRVIDLSGAFRLRDASNYPKFYNFEHREPKLLDEAVYGLPELDRTRQRNARLVANPGCYATAIQLALAPLKFHGRAIVDAMSGVTGAGRKATEEFSFAEIANDVRAYRVGKHQHTPEIEQQLGARVTFVPHLLPVKRGIIATCHVDLSDPKAHVDFSRYHDEPFISLAPSANDVKLVDVVGTNKCRIGWAQDGDHVVVISAIDNLVKGAAGQAVQNLNLMLGLPEQAGLAGLRSFYP
jgi:N-acetyl-gamma-glutamyl-phosphate reductase